MNRRIMTQAAVIRCLCMAAAGKAARCLQIRQSGREDYLGFLARRYAEKSA